MKHRRLRPGKWLLAAAIVLLWAISKRTVLASAHVIPAPAAVASELWLNRAYYWSHAAQTAFEAMLGYLAGNTVALAMACLFALAPMTGRLGTTPLLALQCIPLMAAAPIAEALLPPGAAMAAIAAQAVFFTSIIAAVAGMRSADGALLDVVRAAGGGRWAQLHKVSFRSALPAIVAALEAAVPAALVGAVVAEFAGSAHGIGTAIVTSLQSFHVVRTWALAILLMSMSALMTAAVRRLNRYCAFADRLPIASDWSFAAGKGPSTLREVLAYSVLSSCFLIGLWWAAARLLPLDPFFAKTPGDVWTFFVHAPDAAVRRAQLWRDWGTTLLDTTFGYAVGVCGAIAIGAIASFSTHVSSFAISVARAGRSVPLTATAPVIALIAGRGMASVIIINAVIALFPMTVALVEALEHAPRPAIDVVTAFGGSRRDVLLRVRLPHALPGLLAMVRFTAPLALLAALLAEWLVTGRGLGSRMLLSAAMSDYTTLWSSVVLATTIAVVLYALVDGLEVLLRRGTIPARANRFHWPETAASKIRG